MTNFLLESELESNNKSPEWNPKSLEAVELLESLVKRTAEFSVALGHHTGQLSIFGYDNFVRHHSVKTCDLNEVRGWVYSSLLRKVIEDANAVAILRKESLSSQAFIVWRSLFETYVMCKYIGENSEDKHLSCRYVIHSIIRPTIRRWQEYNESCRRLGKQPHYHPDKIEHQKVVYRELIGEWGSDYAWTIKSNHRTFDQIAKAIEADMLFYRIANNEVHPTFGQNFMLPDVGLPLPAIPLVPVGVTHNSSELSLEFQTANVLRETAQRGAQFTTMPDDLLPRFTALKELAVSVLRELSKPNP